MPDCSIIIMPFLYCSLTPSSVSADICLTSSPFPAAQLTLVTRDHTLNLSWAASDNVGLREFYIAIVSAENYTGNGMGMEFKATAGQTHYSISDSNVLVNGNAFFVFLRAEDVTLHTVNLILGPLLVELTPPLINGSLYVEQRDGHVIVTWSEDTIIEEEGPIIIRYALGRDGRNIL